MTSVTLSLGLPDLKLRERARDNPTFFEAGDIFGAVGLYGDSGENDEICAVASIEAAGLVSD